MRIRFSLAVCLLIFVAGRSGAACVNKFTSRVDGPRHIVTLLTGKLTFQTARMLAAAIRDGKAAPLEWVDASGKSIARQFGELKVVRPMPVSCDGNSSGVIMIAVFPAVQTPTHKMFVKFDANNVVAFDEQSE
jgi:hypothetical protein